MQIQQTATQSQRALNASLQQSSSKDRERRILQLTIDEISQMKSDVKLYKGVGKMSVICLYEPQSFGLINVRDRFMHVPRNTMEEELKGQEKELSDDIANLNKKVGFMYHLSWDLVYASAFKSKYLEKQYNDAQSQLRDIVSFYSSFSKRWLL